METLGGAVLVFLVSAGFVVLAGMGLARFGDDLAEATGWGKLWVGTLLVGIATSLPEVVVNISSVWLQGNPGLALGNVLGANMINIFVLGTVGLIFGVQNLFGNQGRDTELLIATGLGLVILALLFGAFGDIALGPSSVGALLIGVGYVYGMRRVYTAGREDMALEDVPAPTGSARRAWIGFGISALVVIVAGRYLAASADAIAEASGISARRFGHRGGEPAPVLRHRHGQRLRQLRVQHGDHLPGRPVQPAAAAAGDAAGALRRRHLRILTDGHGLSDLQELPVGGRVPGAPAGSGHSGRLRRGPLRRVHVGPGELLTIVKAGRSEHNDNPAKAPLKRRCQQKGRPRWGA